MPDVKADQRAAPRYPLVLVVTLLDLETDAKLAARTSDVSRTGCYVDTLNPIAAGSLVKLHLAHEEEKFETKGRIVYVSPGLGMGIQFQQPVQPEELAILDRWLETVSHSSF